MNDDNRVPETVEMVIDGVLDLHTFSPKDLKHLIPDYLDACLQKNITEVRIIHGKGRGVLRRTVHS
ncbi:MAG: Smr/MutS family protein, partial [Desulfofustis sp.]|nr:Smr/MutS family protein [Desulfofustis sp.]